jgi:tetratricopeptide (TPR) repeat protein
MAPQVSFDPYLKWLGIRPKDQPPHHYRLLGVEIFESDPEVISNAADARMAHVRTYQTGRYSALSQKLLNEIATAKITLLNPEKKAEYDARLTGQMQESSGWLARGTVPSASSSGPPPLPAQRQPLPDAESRPQAAASGGGGMREVLRDWRLRAATAVVAGLLALVATILLPRDDAGQSEVAQDAEAEELEDLSIEPAVPGTSVAGDSAQGNPASASNQTAQKAPRPKPDAGPNGAAVGKPSAPEKPEAVAKPQEIVKPEVTPKPEAMAKPQAIVKPEATAKPDATAKPEPAAKPEATAKPDAAAKPEPAAKPEEEVVKKVPAPDAQARQSAEATVREVFKEDFAGLKSPADRLVLADKLFQQGAATKSNPVERFVLFHMAKDLTAAAGELPRTMDAIDEIAKRFDVNGPAMKAEVLERALLAARNVPPQSLAAHELADHALLLLDDAIAEDQYEVAAQVATKVALPAAKRVGEPDLVREAVTRGRLVQKLGRHFEAVRQAQDRLETRPDEAEAGYTVGRWCCFIKGQWDKGLPLLAKCGQQDLESLAKLDLARPAEADDQVELADAWLKYADREEDEARPQIQLRAGYWLKEALPSLSGLQKVGAEKNLEKISKVVPLVRPRQRGAVQPGNVALAANGTTVVGPFGDAECLIDGNTALYTLERGTAHGTCPCQWTITFDRVYSLREVRLLLFDKSPRRRLYWYAVATSPDGEKYVPLADRSKGQWFGWQVLQFPSRTVKSIRLFGLNESGDKGFYAVELEAYCTPPKTPPGTHHELPGAGEQRKPAEAKPAEAKPGEKPPEEKPGDEKPADEKPLREKPM